MPTKEGDKAVLSTLSKINVEVGRLTSALRDKGVTDIGSLEVSDSINQSCNGICSDLERFTGIDEVQMKRVVKAAAVYNIEQLTAIQDIKGGLENYQDSVNQGCNGIC